MTNIKDLIERLRESDSMLVRSFPDCTTTFKEAADALQAAEDRLKQLQAERDAYREVAIQNWAPTVVLWPPTGCPFKREEFVDAAAKRLMEKNK